MVKPTTTLTQSRAGFFAYHKRRWSRWIKAPWTSYWPASSLGALLTCRLHSS